MNLLSQNPDQRRIWQDDLDGVTPTAVEEIVRVGVAGHVHAPHRHPGPHPVGPRLRARATRSSCSTAPPTATPRCSTIPSASTSCATPTPTSASAGPGPHFCLGAHLARREVAVVFRQLLTRLPDIEVAGDPVPLEAMGIPLVGGIKRLPVTLHAHRPVGV